MRVRNGGSPAYNGVVQGCQQHQETGISPPQTLTQTQTHPSVFLRLPNSCVFLPVSGLVALSPTTERQIDPDPGSPGCPLATSSRSTVSMRPTSDGDTIGPEGRALGRAAPRATEGRCGDGTEGTGHAEGSGMDPRNHRGAHSRPGRSPIHPHISLSDRIYGVRSATTNQQARGPGIDKKTPQGGK